MTTPSSDSTSPAASADNPAAAAPSTPAAAQTGNTSEEALTSVSTTQVPAKKDAKKEAKKSRRGPGKVWRTFHSEDDSFEILAGTDPEYIEDEYLPEDEARKVVAASGRTIDLAEAQLQREHAEVSSRSRTKRSHLRYQERRRAAMVIYEAEARDMDPMQVLELHRLESRDPKSGFPPVYDYTEALVLGVAENLDFIDDLLVNEGTTDGWEYHRLHAVDRAVLRVAVWEIFFNPEVDDVVAISEAVELVHELGVEDHSAYINAVLHHMMLLHEHEETARKAAMEKDAAEPNPEVVAEANSEAAAEANVQVNDVAGVDTPTEAPASKEPSDGASSDS